VQYRNTVDEILKSVRRKCCRAGWMMESRAAWMVSVAHLHADKALDGSHAVAVTVATPSRLR
jgi:hypothetical protein